MPSAGASSENNCDSSPICATIPSAKAAERLRKAGCDHSDPVGAAPARGAGGPAAPSGCRPIAAGSGRNQRPATGQSSTAPASPIATAAPANPNEAISTAQSGTNRIPPMEAPLKASASAAGRLRSNQGATSALIAAPLVTDQPAAVSSAAGSRSHGAGARAQPMAPSAASRIPPRVTATGPKRACSPGRRVTSAALARKCTVMAPETKPTDQPRPSVSACSQTPGP